MTDGQNLPKETFERHSELVQCMAETIGVDLTEKIMRDPEALASFSKMVTRCSNCALVEACEVWLSEYKGPVSETPGYCLNKSTLEKLRSKL